MNELAFLIAVQAVYQDIASECEDTPECRRFFWGDQCWLIERLRKTSLVPASGRPAIWLTILTSMTVSSELFLPNCGDCDDQADDCARLWRARLQRP